MTIDVHLSLSLACMPPSPLSLSSYTFNSEVRHLWISRTSLSLLFSLSHHQHHHPRAHKQTTMDKDGSPARLISLHLAALSAAGAAAFFLHLQLRRRQQRLLLHARPVPRLLLTHSSRVRDLEPFSHYVARQIGLEDINECSNLCKLAHDYVMKTKGCEDNIFAFFSTIPNMETLYIRLIEELDRCILAYFSFHWGHATFMVSQILSIDNEPKRKLKKMVMEVTRKQRFERITRDLKVARIFSTLLEEMKAIGIGSQDDRCTDVMVPAAHSDRSPFLLLMGGGMGAGKSTVLKDILKEAFWLEAAANAVVVEADAFKETDVIYRALNSRGHHDMLQTAELVHQSSTDAASSLLVTALNEGRDVIMDGTLSWEPFVEQTIAMARAVHRRRYRMGVGYKVADDSSITEVYWEPVEDDDNIDPATGAPIRRKPYRIEMVGVICDAYLAVVRGMRRAIMIGRAVRVKSQLKSHKRFATAFPRYCKLVDNARLYCTNSIGTPTLIGWKNGESSLLVDPEEIGCLDKLTKLNDDADSIYELYPPQDSACGAGSVWGDIVLSPLRMEIQHELKAAIQLIESSPSNTVL